ncbi:MAG: 3'-5' exoribonuclease [Deferribacteraceae bacterium]|jgi:DNA polymerase III epsilon subunit family exonuclease|nr:3'-5' exoribonuclease [Deferribacteraceae bacterium]
MTYHQDTPLCEALFAVTDTETAVTSDGLRLVEIASVKVLPGFRIDFPNAFQTLVNPGFPIDRFSMSLHGITDSMTENAPHEDEAVNQLAEFIEGAIFVAHNLSFDHGLISSAMKRHKIISPVSYLFDTLKLSRRLYPYLPNHKLDTLIQVFSLASPRDVRHRALYDADVTALLFVKMLGELSERGVKTLGDLCSMLQGLKDERK